MTMKRIGLVLPFLPVLAALLPACGSDQPLEQPVLLESDAGIDTSALDGPDDVTATTCQTKQDCAGKGVCDPATGACVPCLVSDDCPSDLEVCTDQTCVAQTGCTSDKQCLDQGKICDTAQGICVPCLEDTDCDAGQSCKAKTCLDAPLPCASSKDCNNNLICDKVAGLCVACVGDDDCGDLDHCLETLCVPDTCLAGAIECVDGKTKRTCTANGSGWTTTACGDGQTCFGGVCGSQACAPNATVCDATGKAVQTCSADGTVWGAPVACPGNQTCVDGTCKMATACPAGDVKCLDQQVVQCDPAGAAYQPTDDCTKPGPAGEARTCLSGACVPTQCQPGAALCADSDNEATCKADGSGYAKKACTGGQLCEVTHCEPIVCQPGTPSCSGAVAQTCSPMGTHQEQTSDCGLQGKACVNGACVAKVCAPSAVQCQAGKVGTCKADGTGWNLQACPQGEVCAGGKCLPTVCEPGTLGCNGMFTSTCNASGTAWVIGEDCAKSGQMCEGGACVALSCKPGVVGCQGKVLAECNATGSGWNLGQDCATLGQTCDVGKCVALTCAVGVVSCQSGQLGTCNAAQNGWDLTPCGVGQVCANNKCLNCQPNATKCTGDLVSTCQSDGSWVDQGCDDANTCTTDACSAGQCAFTPVADGTPCPAGNGFQCKSGQCVVAGCPEGTVTIAVDVGGQKKSACGAMGPIWGPRAESPSTFVNDTGKFYDSQTKLTWMFNVAQNQDWTSAQWDCDNLVNGIYGDWRLPTVHELATLIDWAKVNPALAAAFAGSPGGSYWTWNAVAGSSGSAWTLSSQTGETKARQKTDKIYSRCVRGSFDTTVTPRYVAAANQTAVMDKWTNQTWQLVPGNNQNWSQAKGYCSTLAVAGGGWRVPKANELQGIVDYSLAPPGALINVTAFPGTAAQRFWTDTSRAGDNQEGWRVDFANGEVTVGGKDKGYYVRCTK
jgi:hypothetical protein